MPQINTLKNAKPALAEWRLMKKKKGLQPGDDASQSKKDRRKKHPPLTKTQQKVSRRAQVDCRPFSL